MTTLGKKIRKKRRELDMSQRKLAELAGCSHQLVNKIENETITNSKYILIFSSILRLKLKTVPVCDASNTQA